MPCNGLIAGPPCTPHSFREEKGPLSPLPIQSPLFACEPYLRMVHKVHYALGTVS